MNAIESGESDLLKKKWNALYCVIISRVIKLAKYKAEMMEMSHLNWNMQEFRRVWKRKIVIINEKKTYGISNRICFSRFPLYDGFFFAIPLFKNHSCSSNVKFFVSPQQRSLLRQLIFLFFFLKQIHELSKSFYLLTFFSWSITVKIRWFKLRWFIEIESYLHSPLQSGPHMINCADVFLLNPVLHELLNYSELQSMVICVQHSSLGYWRLKLSFGYNLIIFCQMKLN